MTVFSTQLAVSAAGGPPTPPPPTPVPGLPVDGGLIMLFLLALAIGYYSSKKYILNRKGSL